MYGSVLGDGDFEVKEDQFLDLAVMRDLQSNNAFLLVHCFVP
jgi:hypothetical protein